ncbi:MAG: COG4315 family predicted lipoprotein [Candidatus Limnocylindrales bacterium]
MSRSTRLLLLALPFALIVAACSGSGAASPSAAPATPAPSVAASEDPPASEAPPASAPAAEATTIALADSSLGSIIVDADGKTLYAFTNDVDGTSTCYDDCATAWPPLIAGADVSLGDGLDATKLSTVDRTDGTKQVKYGDWPLYYFAADAAAGDTNGQGVGTKWFVVDAAGALIGQ